MARKLTVPANENANNGTDDSPFGANVEADGQADAPPVEPPPSSNLAVEPEDAGDGADFDPAQLGASNGTPAGPDPFDPAALRLSSNGAASLNVKKALLTVPVRKPEKSWFVRVHPLATYALQTAVIELKEDRETYLVAPALWPTLGSGAFGRRRARCGRWPMPSAWTARPGPTVARGGMRVVPRGRRSVEELTMKAARGRRSAGLSAMAGASRRLLLAMQQWRFRRIVQRPLAVRGLRQ